VDWKAECG